MHFTIVKAIGIQINNCKFQFKLKYIVKIISKTFFGKRNSKLKETDKSDNFVVFHMIKKSRHDILHIYSIVLVLSITPNNMIE